MKAISVAVAHNNTFRMGNHLFVVCLVLILLFAGTLPSAAVAAPVIYIAQATQGTNDGASCANAHSVSWFNTPSNWGTSSNQINPNSTVYLCGTITSNLTFQSDGAAGNYITVDGTGATMNASFIAGPNISYGRIRNVKWIDNFDGVTFACTACDNFIFTNTSADNWHGDSWVYLADDGVTQLPHDITISNNYLRTSTGNYGDTQIDIFKCAGCTKVTIEGNHLEMRIAGASPYNNAHDDIMQSFQKGGDSKGPPSNLTIRFNRMVMNTTETMHRSWCMLEHLGGTNNIYGNLFLGINGAGGANGCDMHNSQSSAVFNFFNNTLVSKAGASNNQLNLQGGGTINLRNNIFYAAGDQGWTLAMSTMNRSNNLWYGSRIPSCSTYSGELCNFNPQFANYDANDFALQPDSPALVAGINLGSPYNSYLVAGSSWPNPTLAQRSSSGNWAIGAYDASSGASFSLKAPTNLRTVPQ